MAHFEVDPTALEDTAHGLRRCVDVAREFVDHRARLTELVEDCGSHHVRAAAEHLIRRWGYGMRVVVGDAEHLAGQLERSAAEYRRLEAEINGALE